MMQLTPEQQSLIPIYVEKWRGIAFSTKRIEQSKAAQAVNLVYDLIQQPEPEILFFDSPKTALKVFRNKRQGSLLSPIRKNLQENLRTHLLEQLDGSSEQVKIIGQLRKPLERPIWEQFTWKIQDELRSVFNDHLRLEEWACHGSYFDFLVSVIGCSIEATFWEAFQTLTTECGWIFPFENICGICDHPISISFDEKGLLHQEGKAAIEFADGFSVYSYHGVTLPEVYGKLHPSDWEPEWLLKENDELREALFQGVDYLKVCQKFPTTELDIWKNCTLLKIDQEINGEQVHVLKVVEPTSRNVYAVRVSSHLRTARGAFLEAKHGG
jgi:hypothetical protein